MKQNSNWLIFVVVVPVCLFVLCLVIGYNGLYGQDSFEYLRYAQAIRDHFIGGPMPGPFRWPVLYPLTGAILSFAFTLIHSMQLINISCFGLTAWYLVKILNILYPEKGVLPIIYIGIFLVFSPFILRSSISVVSEPMALLFITVFFFHFLRYWKEDTQKDLVFVFLFFTLAVNTRYPSTVILIIPLIRVLFMIGRKKLTTLFISLILGMLVFLPNLLFHSFVYHSVLQNQYLTGWSFPNLFASRFINSDGINSYPLPNLVSVLSVWVHPGFVFVGGLLFIFTIGGSLRIKLTAKGAKFSAKDAEGRVLKSTSSRSLRKVFASFAVIKSNADLHIVFYYVLAISTALYLFFLAGLPMQNQRLLLPVFPLVLLLLYPGFIEITELKLIPKLKYPMVILLMILQTGLCYRAILPFYTNNKEIREITGKLLKHPGQTIYTFNIDMAFTAYGVKNRTVNIWSDKIRKVESHALILVNRQNLTMQWKGMNPMMNWLKLEKEGNLIKREAMPGGWELYETTP